MTGRKGGVPPDTPEWYEEALYTTVRQAFRVGRVLHREATEHQDLIIFENPTFGRVMALDRIIQTTEGDEFVYHEMLTHVPILGHGKVKRVLIIGGGDGGVLREALRHPDVERVTMVEIDPSVIEMSREYLPRHSAGAFDDPRADLVIADGARYVAETGERFDVVIIDSTDPMGPGAVLFSEEFYADCKRCMTPGGVLVTQNGVPALQPQEVTDSYRHLGKHFADVRFYVAAVPTYYGGFMALGWASDDKGKWNTPVDELEKRYKAAGLETRYYNPALHRGAFALPNYVAALMK